MKVIASRNGTVLLRKEDGTILMQDDDGTVLTNIAGRRLKDIKTVEWDDILNMNDALTSKYPYVETTKLIDDILEGRPKR